MMFQTTVFEKDSKGRIREPIAPSTVRWEDANGDNRHATSHTDSDFYVHWTLDTGEVVKWGHLVGVVIGERGQRSMELDSKWATV